MRTLTSVQSETYILSQLNVNITPTDTSTTWTFGHIDIVDISGLSWEIPFGGGLGKPSTYNITLSSSLGFIKDSILKLPKSEIRLRIDLNQDTFYPHVGRVQSIQRDGNDPNIFSLKVYDRFLDQDPFFPLYSMTQSYDNVHPEVIAIDFGKPSYYGKHLRPIFHTPVDCQISSLIAPFNISSANHVNSVFFNNNPSLSNGIVPSIIDNYYIDENILSLMNTTWDHSSETLVNCFDFEIKDFSWKTALYKYSFQDIKDNSSTEPISRGLVVSANQNVTTGVYNIFDEGGSVYRGEHRNLIEQKIAANINRVNHITFTYCVEGWSSVTSLGLWVGAVESNQTVETLLNAVGSDFMTGSIFTHSMGTTNIQEIFSSDQQYHYFFCRGEVNTNSSARYRAEMQYEASLQSDAYQNYSIYSPTVNCSDIAITTNPIGILNDIFDQSSIFYVSLQSSNTQVLVDSYQFNCIFGERQPITSIINEFGSITGSYLWLGDSGMINYRCYQESSNADINATITTSDMLEFVLKENPIGVSNYFSPKAKRIRVDYNYDFVTQTYLNSIQADPLNTDLCATAESNGIDTEAIAQTKYILDLDTSSFYLGNIVRRSTQSEEFAELILPARYFGLELTDVLKIQHPMLVGSEGLYQIVAITPDFLNGVVKVRSSKLLSLSD